MRGLRWDKVWGAWCVRGGELVCSADAECCSKMGEGDSNPSSEPTYILDYVNLKFQHPPKIYPSE